MNEELPGAKKDVGLDATFPTISVKKFRSGLAVNNVVWVANTADPFKSIGTIIISNKDLATSNQTYELTFVLVSSNGNTKDFVI